MLLRLVSYLFCFWLIKPSNSSPCFCGQSFVEDALQANNLTMDQILRHLAIMKEVENLSSADIIPVGDDEFVADLMKAAKLIEVLVEEDPDENHIESTTDLADPVSSKESSIDNLHIGPSSPEQMKSTTLEETEDEERFNYPEGSIEQHVEPREAGKLDEASTERINEEHGTAGSREALEDQNSRIDSVKDRLAKLNERTHDELKVKSGSVSSDPDDEPVVGSIIQVPLNACEEGKQRDATGTCREAV